MDAVIKLNYVNKLHPTAFSSINTVYQYYKPHVSREQVKNILSYIDTYTQKKQQRKVKLHAPFIVWFKRQVFQLDLIDVSYMAKDNNNIKFLLVVIDTATRHVWVQPLKNKSTALVATKFENILKTLDKLPIRCHSDLGMEFRGKIFKNLLEKYNIQQTFPKSSPHCPHVERVNRTLENLIYRYLKSSNGPKYIDSLQDIVNLYNRRTHSSIKPLSPFEAEKDENRNQLIQILMKKYLKIFMKATSTDPSFKVGDTVKISVTKQTFHRGYKDQFKDELFTITDINVIKKVPMYQLTSIDEEIDNGEPLEGLFYKEELVKVGKGKTFELPSYKVLNRKNQSVLIEWNGLPDIFNSWIPLKLIKEHVTSFK